MKIISRWRGLRIFEREKKHVSFKIAIPKQTLYRSVNEIRSDNKAADRKLRYSIIERAKRQSDDWNIRKCGTAVVGILLQTEAKTITNT